MARFLLRSTVFLLLVSAVFIIAARWVGRAFEYDVLAYTSRKAYNSIEQSLKLYDLRHGVSAPVVPQMEAYAFSFSADGKLAFSLEYNDDMDIYVLDTKSVDSTPINITHSPATDDIPLKWSPDGRYLAFSSFVSDQNALIYVWDGKTAVNVTPRSMSSMATAYIASWSADGRLAFSVNYGFTPESAPSEIHLWDGNSTTNLSQTPFDGDGGAIWSDDGQLAFVSGSGGVSHIYVWDGESVKGGIPDRNSFAKVAPELFAYYSFPTWTNDGQLAFEVQAPQDTHVQIYLWDGNTATNISQNPTLHNGSPQWSNDGRWAFVTFFSSQQLIYVRDADNNPLLTVEGQYAPAWSLDGQLIFCKRYGNDWVVSKWDGQEITRIVSGHIIYAQWPGGEDVFCSSG